MRTPLAVCAALLCMLCLDPVTQSHTLYPTSCNAAPYNVDVQQPDGSVLTLRATGNSVTFHTETEDGYTVIRNANGSYDYAALNENGELMSTGYLAHNPDQRTRKEKARLRNTALHLRLSDEVIQQKINDFEALPEYRTNRPAQRFPSMGNQKVLVILIQYPDLMSEHSNSDFESLMNEPGYNGSGSFRDYFLKNSMGQLDLDADVFGWYTSEENHDYYGHQNGFHRTRALMAEAIDAAEAAGVDFSQYDNDGDGIVDAVVGIHSGPGAEVGAQTQYIWSHRWTLGPAYERTYDGVEISDYMINPETRPWGMVGVGVFCHEFGHVLGLPDLYDTDNSSSGIGNWGLMSNGAWLNLEKTPANMTAWSKYSQEWTNPEVITSGAYTLEASDEHSNCYRVNTDDPNEYFLLENRQNLGNDTYIPGTGLAIWHIDEDKTTMYPGSNSVNADENNKGIDLEEADGLFQLDTGPFQGDNGDLFPGSSGLTRFAENTVPSSNLYNGNATEIKITNIQEIDETIYFRLNDEITCSIVNAVPGQAYSCDNGYYDQEIIVTYDFAPEGGFLDVNGNTFPITGSPQSVMLSDLEANGALHDIRVEFTDDLSCNYVSSGGFTAPLSYDLHLFETTCNPGGEGITTSTYSSYQGCDSVVTITTSLLASYNFQIHSTTCSFDLAGSFTNIYSTYDGCDSIVTLINDYLAPDTIVINSTTCDEGLAGTELFHFVSADGCDSMVLYETVLLPSYNETIYERSCDPASTGTETMIFSTNGGCDSIVTVVTLLSEEYNITLQQATCDPDLAGEETYYLSTVNGCDSVVTIEREYVELKAEYTADPLGFDVGFTSYSIGAEEHVWIFGDGHVSTLENPVHHYNYPGIYFVILAVTNSECEEMRTYTQYIEVKETELTAGNNFTADSPPDAAIDVFPNPTFGPVDLQVSGFEDNMIQMSLFDIKGNMVRREVLPDGNSAYHYDLSHISPGIYIMQVASRDKVVNKRIFMTN